jgi:hypothetical protein
LTQADLCANGGPDRLTNDRQVSIV